MSAESAASDEVARFRAGDGVAFRSIVARYSPYLAAVARSFAADGDDLQDLLQQAWARIYERRGDFDGRGSLLGWALAVCRRECLGRLRRETARVAAFLYLEPLVTLAAAVALLGEPVHVTTIAGGLIVLAGVFLVQHGDDSSQNSIETHVASGDLTL